MINRCIDSREYKIMLKADPFAGNENKLLETAGQFWSDFTQAAAGLVIDTDGNLDKLKKRRIICFYDTQFCRLHQNNYVFRQRADLQTGKTEVTLKFRHPDRFISQDRIMDARDVEKGTPKFEEDIKPPFVSLYSYSTKQEVPASASFNIMANIVSLFPDLETSLSDYQQHEEIDKVGLVTARELLVKGADFQISDVPKIEAKCALIAWYNNQGDPETPILVEFSFKYGEKNMDYDRKTAQRACEVFGESQKLEWADPDSKTKTAYVYSQANACEG